MLASSYLGALLGVIAFGSYMIPLKIWPKLSSWSFLRSVSIGVFVSGLALSFIFHKWSIHFSGLWCGFIWVLGAGLCFWAVQKENDLSGVGVRAMGISILTSFLFGLLYFKEKVSLYPSLIAISFILLGLVLLAPQLKILKHWRSLGAGVIFGSYLLPYQISSLHYLDFFLSFSIGIFVSAHALVFLLNRQRKAPNRPERVSTIASIGAGILWSLGSIGSFWALEGLGFTVGYPLTQLNLLVAIFWGVLIFKEHPSTQERLKIGLAAFVVLLGAILLNFSKISL